MYYFRRYALAIALVASSTAFSFSQESDPRLCLAQGDPVAEAPFNLVDSYCIPSSSALGSLADPATIAGEGTFAANANGQLDVFVIWEPGQIASSEGESFTYSSSLSWNSTQPDAVFKEWVGNFALSPPQAFMITNSANPELTPAELVLSESSATVTDRVFSHDQFPPVPLGRYHIQVTGLDPFEEVAFTKTAAGAHVSVVPEPATSMPLVGAVIAIGLATRRRQR